MVSVIVKVPITDGSFWKIEHKEVIAHFVDTCRTSAGLLAALKAVGDVMVSDYNGHQGSDTFWFDVVYCKIQSTRQDAAALILSEVHNLKSYEGNQTIFWGGAEMANRNMPPSKKHDQLAVPKQRKVYMGGPNGDIDLSTFQKLAIDDVPAMAITNVSVAQVAAFAECAAQGGSGIQRVVQGSGLQFKLTFETFIAILEQIWFEEDWPPLMQSPFVNTIAQNSFACKLDLYRLELQRLLCACVLPWQGLTLAKATHNFHMAESKESSLALETFACCSAG